MAEKLRGCPQCGHFSTVEFWDKHTREQEGIAEDDVRFTSCGAPKEQLIEEEVFFRCPLCNEEVEGVDLKGDKKTRD